MEGVVKGLLHARVIPTRGVSRITRDDFTQSYAPRK